MDINGKNKSIPYSFGEDAAALIAREVKSKEELMAPINIILVLEHTVMGVDQYEVGSDEWADFMLGACRGAVDQIRENIRELNQRSGQTDGVE